MNHTLLLCLFVYFIHPTTFFSPLLVFAYCIFLLKVFFECVTLLLSSPLLSYSFTVFKDNTNSSMFSCCRGEEAIILCGYYLTLFQWQS